MSNFTTFFPSAGGGGGEGSGINSYAPFSVVSDNNPQGYIHSTGVYTNPVDSSVWLKTGNRISDVTPRTYPNAFSTAIEPLQQLNQPFIQTGIPANGEPTAIFACTGLAGDYDNKHIYYFPNYWYQSASVRDQYVYKLDSSGTYISSALVPKPTGTPTNTGMSIRDASYNGGGNSGAGSIWVFYVDGYNTIHAVEYSMSFVILTQYNVSTTSSGLPAGNYISGACFDVQTQKIYMCFMNNSNLNNNIFMVDPSNRTAAAVQYPTYTSTGTPYSGTSREYFGIESDPVTGVFYTAKVGNNQQSSQKWIFTSSNNRFTLVDGNSAVFKYPLDPTGTTRWYGTKLCILYPNPTDPDTVPIYVSLANSDAIDKVPSYLANYALGALVGDTTARTDSSGSAQPLFIKLK